MQYEMILSQKKYGHENGKKSLCTVKYPLFSQKDGKNGPSPAAVNDFYREYAEHLFLAAEKGVLMGLADKYSAETVAVEAESCVTLCRDREISLFTDLRHYADRTLVGLFRISQSWICCETGKKEKNKRSAWLIRRAPRPVGRLRRSAKEAGTIPADGFYVTENKTVLYRCTFKEGDGASLRRSEHGRFILQYEFNEDRK